MRNIAIRLAYDGTRYLGWQKTKEGPSIEQELQDVLEKVLQHPIALQASSRTDAGVHARDLVVNFRTPHTIDTDKLHISLCCLLPKDIAATSIQDAPPDFHPTLQAAGKEYHYWVCTDTFQYPEHRLYSWHYPHELNIDAMREAAAYFIGTHDFAAFCNMKKNEEYAHHIRQLTDVRIIPAGTRIRFEIFGTQFLYKMVRNIVGTLVYVGQGKINPSDVKKILNLKDRTLAGVTAPAHGLTLFKTFMAT